MEKVKIYNHAMCGGLWFFGWLFTIGLLQLGFEQGLYALILWPYYIGVAVGNVFFLSL